MGTYSNVDASGLKSAVSTALSELNSYTLNGSINNLNSSGVMESSVKSNIIGYLNNISDSTNLSGSIATLKNNLNTLSTAAGHISNYQTIESEIKALEPYRTKEVENTNVWYDSKGQRHEDTYTETVDDWDVINKINNKQNELKQLENTINSCLS